MTTKSRLFCSTRICKTVIKMSPVVALCLASMAIASSGQGEDAGLCGQLSLPKEIPSKILRNKKLGTVDGYEIRWLTSERGPDPNIVQAGDNLDVEPNVVTCDTLEVSKGKDRHLIVVSENESNTPQEAQAPVNSIRLKGRIVVVEIESNSRYAENGTKLTFEYQLAPQSPKAEGFTLKELRNYGTSPTDQEVNRISKLLQSGEVENIRRAVRDVAKLEHNPTGWREEFTDQFLKLTHELNVGFQSKTGKKISAKEKAKLLKAWIASIHAEESAKPDDTAIKELPSSIYRDAGPNREDIGLWNDLGFYLAEGGDRETAENIFRWVVEKAPARTVAHLNRAENLWAMSKVKNNKIGADLLKAESVSEALSDEGQSGESDITIALAEAQIYLGQIGVIRSGPAKIDPELKKVTERWMIEIDPSLPGFTELEFKVTKDCVDFFNQALLPMATAETGGSTGRTGGHAKLYDLEKPVCYRGVRISKATPRVVIEGDELVEAVLDQDTKFEIATKRWVMCAAQTPFTWRKSKTQKERSFRCTLATDQTIADLPLKGKTELNASADGEPFQFILSRDAKVGDFEVKANTLVMLEVPIFVLAKATQIGSTVFPSGTKLTVNVANRREEPKRKSVFPLISDALSNKFTALVPEAIEVELPSSPKSQVKVMGYVHFERGAQFTQGYLVDAWSGVIGSDSLTCKAKSNVRLEQKNADGKSHWRCD